MSNLPDDYILPSGKTVKEVNEYFSLPLEEQEKLRPKQRATRLSVAELKELGLDTEPQLVISSKPRKKYGK
jgi:hypothetical protein